jgi:hypothetical protein
LAHLHRYTNEFDFRYNERKASDAERADKALKQICGKRLTYRRIDQTQALNTQNETVKRGILHWGKLTTIIGDMSTSSTATANVSLGLMVSEASSLLEQARKYRTEMDALPESDPRKEVYEKIIRDLLDRAQKLSVAVTSNAPR